MNEETPKARKGCPLCHEINTSDAAQCARCGFGFNRVRPVVADTWLDRKLVQKGVVPERGAMCFSCLKPIPVDVDKCPYCHRAPGPQETGYPRVFYSTSYFWMPGTEDALESADVGPQRADLKLIPLGVLALAAVLGVGWLLLRFVG